MVGVSGICEGSNEKSAVVGAFGKNRTSAKYISYQETVKGLFLSLALAMERNEEKGNLGAADTCKLFALGAGV
jgi:hypothetical protein